MKPEVGPIAERVSSLEASMLSLTKNVDRLVETELSRKTPWGVIIAACGMMLTVFGLVIAPIKTQLDEQTNRQNRLADYIKTIEQKLPRGSK